MKKFNAVKRFRAEIRDRPDIGPNMTIKLSDTKEREVNTLAAELLLKDIFGDLITTIKAHDGIVCGSREEAGAARLAQYTARKELLDGLLLSTLTANEIETYLNEKTSKVYKVFVPDTPEVRMIERLAHDVEDVRYGI